ncbi:MAG: hypothetical protein SPF27_02930 [Methanobrevibacter boviskoreani]|nr:hypothetical protein [Methanobrevibacter boviskoreani]
MKLQFSTVPLFKDIAPPVLALLFLNVEFVIVPLGRPMAPP